MPEIWQTKKHDKGILKAVSQKGFDFLKQVIGDKDYGLDDITEDLIVNEKEADAVLILYKRIEEICLVYREYQQQSKILMKRPKTVVTPDGITTITGLQIQNNQNDSVEPGQPQPSKI